MLHSVSSSGIDSRALADYEAVCPHDSVTDSKSCVLKRIDLYPGRRLYSLPSIQGQVNQSALDCRAARSGDVCLASWADVNIYHLVHDSKMSINSIQERTPLAVLYTLTIRLKSEDLKGGQCFL